MAGNPKPGIVRRMYEASLHIIGKDTPAWFDPGNPLAPVVGNAAAVEGRQFSQTSMHSPRRNPRIMPTDP
jgi:hypothetical protein